MFTAKRILTRLATLSLLAGLGACAHSATPPDEVMRALPADQIATLHIAEVSGEAQQGAPIPQFHIDHVIQMVKADLTSERPLVMFPVGADATTPQTAIRIVFTEYDEGSSFARFMLAGLGQIRLGGDVVFVDIRSGQEIGRYKLSKQFAFGGMYGATTRMEDVEAGFAKSVVELLREKKAEILRERIAGSAPGAT